MRNLKLLIVGAGSIGKRHTRNLIKIGIKPTNLIVMDTRKDRLNEVHNLGVNNTHNNFEKALKEDFDAAIICSPTSMHIDQSIKIAKLKKHLLIEKPLCSNLKNIDTLVKLVKKNRLITMIAYIFRFMPSLQFTKKILDQGSIGKTYYLRGEFSEYLPDWHPYEDYRSFYMAKKTQGGGSILDQCHIMDLAHHLIGDFKSVSALNLKLSDLSINADDISELIIKHKSGVISSIHTDIFGRNHKKNIEIKGSKGNISWDFYKNEVIVYNAKKKLSTKYNKFEKDFNKSYIEELKHFLRSIKNKSKTSIPLNVGIETMKLIIAAEQSQKLKKEKTIKY